MRCHINYGDERIAYSIRFLPRPARRISIHVSPDGTVTVDAPQETEIGDIAAAVRRRLRWIWVRLRAHREHARHLLPREYVSGESHYYLGRRHVLKVIVSPKDKSGVKLLRGRLEVRVRERSAGTVRDMLDAWYRRRADEVFARRIAVCTSKTPWIKQTPSFRLLTMRTQWGSCSPQGRLVLNPLLVKAPTPCIDYVIFHELCHLREHNHSARFYDLLGSLMGNWQERKSELDALADQLFNR